MSSSTQETSQEPTVITLDHHNSVRILAQYVELAQQKGAYLLHEAELLKRAMDVLINNVPDKELNPVVGRQLLIQGVQKGQAHGAYSLNDASLLNRVVQFVIASLQESSAGSSSTGSSPSVPVDDLSDLAEPIPLKPKEV
jgi:hypothetical protein